MHSINLKTVNHIVLCKQHLTDDSRIDDIVQIAKDIGGLHATDPTTSYLSLYARTNNFAKETLDDELHIKRSLAKIRVMRKTLYILPKEMIPTAFAATKAMVEKNSRGFAEFRGVSPEDFETVSRSILEMLAGRDMSIFEIKKNLQTRLDVSSILNLMCDRGLLIRGRREKGWSNRNHKYSLFNEYLPDVNLNEVEEREAQTLLVLQYLSSFGPVTENDIAWWTGLGKTQVRDVIENIREQLVQAEISEIRGSFIMLRQDWDRAQNTGPLNTPTINLLPILDPYLMGYKERERYLDHENYDKIYDRTGNATSTILFDGRVIGVWDFEISDVPSVKIFLFGEAEEGVLDTIRSKARKTGEFIADKEVQLRECKSMVTLTSRTAGGFMSPLRD